MSIIYEELTTNVKFLDINFRIINNKIQFDVYNKPTHFLVTFTKLSPTAHEQQIALLLARRIARVNADNKNNKLQKLKYYLLNRKHSEKITDYSIKKLFQSRKQKSNDKNVITFTRTYNPNYQFSVN